VTRASPRFALASSVTDVTLYGDNFPVPASPILRAPFAVVPPAAGSEDGRAVVRVLAEDGELVSVERGEFHDGSLHLTVNRVALTGPVHFEVCA
jgi:hypothetical protein